ncbi:MAG: LLM class flavin-dependent oxidoreductase [Pseudomonadota bacterium]
MTEIPHFRDAAPHHLRLGLFSANCKGGLAISTAPGGWDATWENNIALAKMADQRGLDFHLPVARWHGSGHSSGWMDESIDPIAWSSGILAATERMHVFSTMHVAMHHPIAAAKACASASLIGNGRFGLNMVCGWNKPEYDMFGFRFLEDHVEKYEHGQEWFDIVEKIWSVEDAFDHDGKHWQLSDVQGSPKPAGGRPIIVNAAASDDGRAFAVRNCDYLLTVFPEIDQAGPIVNDMKAKAQAIGKDIKSIGITAVVCRPTMKEAQEFDEYYSNECADWECVDYNLKLVGLYGGHMPADVLQLYRRRFAQGFGGYPIVGDPDHVAAQYAKIQAAGVDACTMTFFNYLEELPYFCDEVLPRLENLGVRQPVIGT